MLVFACVAVHCCDALAGVWVASRQVNNVGMSYPSALYFHELDEIDKTMIDNLLAININATTQVGTLLSRWYSPCRLTLTCVWTPSFHPVTRCSR